MYKIEEEFLNNICKDYAKALVGKLCSQIESLQKFYSTHSEEFKCLEHAKNLRRELIYQNFRDLRNNIKSHSNGLSYKKFNIYPSRHRIQNL